MELLRFVVEYSLRRYADVSAMEWLDDDVIYRVACTVLLMLLVRELLATVAQCVPLSRTPDWLPSAVLYVVSGVEPFCVNAPG